MSDIRNQLARDLDPFAWRDKLPDAEIPVDFFMQCGRSRSLALADRLLSNPRYAIVELPEPDLDQDGAQVWDFGADSITAFPGMVSVDLGHRSIGSGGVGPATAMSLAAILAAASRQAQTQQTTEEQNGA